jgi:hypothetical protein
MNTPEMSEINKITQLAKTFSTACEKAVAEGKVATRAAPVVTAAVVVLTVGVIKSPFWGG